MSKNYKKKIGIVVLTSTLVLGSGFLIFKNTKSKNNIKEDVKITNSTTKEVENEDKKDEVTKQDLKTEGKKDEVEKQDLKTKNEKEEIKNLDNFLFVGDSFTVLCKNQIKENNNHTYIRAKSGVTPEYWVDKVGNMPEESKVKAVSILIGVNGAYKPKTNLKHTKELINNIIEKYPDKTIFVQKIFPVAKTFKNANPKKFNKDIKQLNKGIKEFCKGKENIKYIDATDGFVDENGYLKRTADGLHIDTKYLSKYYDNVEQEILEQGL